MSHYIPNTYLRYPINGQQKTFRVNATKTLVKKFDATIVMSVKDIKTQFPGLAETLAITENPDTDKVMIEGFFEWQLEPWTRENIYDNLFCTLENFIGAEEVGSLFVYIRHLLRVELELGFLPLQDHPDISMYQRSLRRDIITYENMEAALNIWISLPTALRRAVIAVYFYTLGQLQYFLQGPYMPWEFQEEYLQNITKKNGATLNSGLNMETCMKTDIYLKARLNAMRLKEKLAVPRAPDLKPTHPTVWKKH